MEFATTRRRLMALAGQGAAAALVLPAAAQTASQADDGLVASIAAIEKGLGGRIGVSIHDTGSDRRWTHRGDERFPMCSTFKLLAAAAILDRVDDGTDTLDRRLVIREEDLVDYSPVLESRVGGNGVTLATICRAAVTLSDNTAGNMMLKAIGGPEGFTAFMRSIGDDVTRLDRREPDLNTAIPGDERDTTSPRAMTASVETLLFGKALSPRSRRQLSEWMLDCKTGDGKLRAGLPKRWRIGEKTGGGANGTSNDVAALWPPIRDAVIVSVFATGNEASPEARNAAIAAIGKALSETIRAS
ncbi:MAG: class A beta-lactamase [Bosea sp.]|nr:class A beta-lactamase [Bosea sp. (in: a-proteobacteria)]